MVGFRPNMTAPFRMHKLTSCGIIIFRIEAYLARISCCKNMDSAKPPTKNIKLISNNSIKIIVDILSAGTFKNVHFYFKVFGIKR